MKCRNVLGRGKICGFRKVRLSMSNYDKLKEIFPEIPEYSGIDIWGDFWDEEYKEPQKEEETVLVN